MLLLRYHQKLLKNVTTTQHTFPKTEDAEVDKYNILVMRNNNK